jgi:hypothetical protein
LSFFKIRFVVVANSGRFETMAAPKPVHGGSGNAGEAG